MSDEISVQVQATILKLETTIKNKENLDEMWLEIKRLLLNEINTLPNLPTSNCNKLNSTFKKSQQFWNSNPFQKKIKILVIRYKIVA